MCAKFASDWPRLCDVKYVKIGLRLYHDARARAVVLYALIAALMSAAWLPVFPYLNRHYELLKPHLPTSIFSSQVLRPIVGIALYAAAATLGWFVSPYIAVAIFVSVVIYYAWISQGIPWGR